LDGDISQKKKFMKKLTLLILIWSSWLQCHAPSSGVATIRQTPVLYKYTDCPLEIAFIMVESKFHSEVVNRVTGATGLLQITPVMVDEVNRICRIMGLRMRFRMRDAFDPDKSIMMWRIAIMWHDPQDVEEAVCIWFGRGVQYDGQTWKEYHERLKSFL